MNRRQKLVQQQFLNNEAAILRRLNSVYGQALKDVNGNIERLMERFDPETGDLMQSAIYQIKYQEMLKAQIEGVLNELQVKQFTSVSDYLDTCYEDGFIGSVFDLHGQDIPLTMPINQEAVVRAVQLESKISQGLYTRLGENVDLLKKKITAQVSRSILTGTSFADCARQLAGYTNIGFNRSMRIARTEGHRIQNTAAMDAMRGSVERGADLVKQWDATLDAKTRESHVAVDGEIRELDEEFSNGLQFPGDPDGSAAEVINCRCALLRRARWALDGGSFTKYNNFTKQIETFESPEAYKEFKEAFFSPENRRYMNYVEEMERKYGTKDFKKLLERMSDSEYNRYSRLLANNPVYNKKAIVDEIIEEVVDPDELFKRNIWTIRDRVKKNGYVTDDDLHEAGRLVRDARGLEQRNAEAQKVYEACLAEYDEYYANVNALRKQRDALEQKAMGAALTEEKDFDIFAYLESDDSSTTFDPINWLTDSDRAELNRLDTLINEMLGSEELHTLTHRLAEARVNLHLTGKSAAENLKETLSKAIEMGHKNVDNAVRHIRSDARQPLVDALDYYPTSWIEKVLPEPLNVKKVNRGYFDKFGNTIALSGDGDSMFETAIHELGHCFEHKVSISDMYTSFAKSNLPAYQWQRYYNDYYPDGQTFILDAERAFYKRRTAGETLEWLGEGYSRKEETRKDNFIHPYMGKDYGNNDFELVSMGFEYAYTNPDFLAKDPDMESWIYGILALYD